MSSTKVVAPMAMRTPVLAAPKAVIFNSRKRVGDGVWDG
jgi:hypothetical protein